MNEDTMKLLKECNLGCKMAVSSMKQVEEYVQDDNLEKILKRYRTEHEKLEQESSDMLNEWGCSGKEPGKMASAFSWLTTEMKMKMKDDSNQIAKIMMDGCNMGIQSICERKHQYCEASKAAVELSDRLVKAEENFMTDLKEFL